MSLYLHLPGTETMILEAINLRSERNGRGGEEFQDDDLKDVVERIFGVRPRRLLYEYGRENPHLGLLFRFRHRDDAIRFKLRHGGEPGRRYPRG